MHMVCFYAFFVFILFFSLHIYIDIKLKLGIKLNIHTYQCFRKSAIWQFTQNS